MAAAQGKSAEEQKKQCKGNKKTQNVWKRLHDQVDVSLEVNGLVI